MKIDTSNWEVLGHVSVDSGQLLLVDPCYIDSRWTEKEFLDLRVYEHKQTKERLEWRKDFGNYEEPIPSFGNKTMNQLNKTGEWTLLPKPVAEGFNYNAVCETTLSEKQGGQLDLGVAFSSGWGDGRYAVKVQRNEEGRIMQVFIDFDY